MSTTAVAREARARALGFVETVWGSFLQSSGMEPHLLRKLRVVSAEPGRVDCTMLIEPMHCNRLSILHGGVLACLVDTAGSLAVASRGLYSTGVSTDIQISYLRSGGAAGSVIRAVASCDGFGKTLAYTKCDFFDAKGRLVARGSHTKYVAKAREHDKNDLAGLRTIEELESEQGAEERGTGEVSGSGTDKADRIGWTVPS